jgi:hypothetical protein
MALSNEVDSGSRKENVSNQNDSAWVLIPSELRKAPAQKKGPQLALGPLNGQGIAGYVPEP